MFKEHRIICESRQPVLYLFTQPLGVSPPKAKGMFESLPEELLVGWAEEYMETYHVSFKGRLMKVVVETMVVRELALPTYILRNLMPVSSNKVLEFKMRSK